MASCCSGGKLLVFDESKKWDVAFKYSSSDKLSNCAFSQLKNNLVACGSDSGELRLFDFEAKKLSRMFLEHTDKITGIKFSQINDALMISSGLDKRLNFQDTKQLKVVKNWNQSEPISSFDFFHDGLHIIYSTIYGTVNLMDLRYSDVPLMTLRGQSDKQVNSVTFAVKRKKKEGTEELIRPTVKEAVHDEDTELAQIN